MRSDYLLYLLASVFFIITAVSFVLVMDQMEKSLWVLTAVILGLFSAGLGYTQRPKAKTETMPPPKMQTAETAASQVKETPIAENVEKPAEPTITHESVSPMSTRKSAPIPAVTPTSKVNELVEIRGINEKRATQLKALGIHSVEALAHASAEDLAKSLTVSPRITRMWIGTAKKLKK